MDTRACQPASPTSKLALSFRPETTLGDLADWIGAQTCKSVVFEASVGKHRLKSTIVSPNRYTPKQALELVIDAIEATGATVTQKPDTFIVKAGPNMPKCPDVAVAPSVTPDPDDPVAVEIHAGIKRIDPTNYEVTRAVSDKLFADPKPFVKGARIVPAMKNGKPEGLKLYAIRPSSIIAKLGFSNGDTVHSVNKISLAGADALEPALAELTKQYKAKKLKRVEFAIIRRGNPMTLVITIK